MITITCKIPEKLDTELEAIAAQRQVSKSEIVRESIQHQVEQHEKKIKLTAYDVMKGGCGIVKGGPRDLATHLRHMKGFGRD